MDWIALAVLIDSIVVTTVGFKLKRTAEKQAKVATDSFKQALQEIGPQVMVEAIALMQKEQNQ